MISVAEALHRLFALATPTEVEEVALLDASGRVLARPLPALRDQPPFAASAMDGYALRSAEARTGASFRVIGEAAAGRGWDGPVGAGEAVRIFTGAPVPPDADRVVIQEDVARDGDIIRLTERIEDGLNIRPAGIDFTRGAELAAPRRLSPADIALIAAFGHARVPVHRRPVVTLLPTGDELVQPGEPCGPGQIVASNSYGLAALFRQAGAEVRLLPVARDDEASLTDLLKMAEGSDLTVTIGGASVGDHDIVGKVTARLGMQPAFWKIAMRPGKPLMAGKLGHGAMVGLPGNPVSAMVCGLLFVLPMLHAMQGLPPGPARQIDGRLAAPVAANGAREHYMRAELTPDGVRPLGRQDSSLLTILTQADALLVRPPHASEGHVGDPCRFISLHP